MERRVNLAEKIASVLRKTRYESNKSQEYMAMGIGVSKKTIQNWENGTSTPDILQVEEWFRLLEKNPLQLYLEVFLPNGINAKSDKETTQNLKDCIEQLPYQTQAVLLYLLSGKHGSSPFAILQMLNAHLQVPLKDRVLNASLILQNYEMECELGKLICPDEVQPDLPFLADAIYTGRASALRHFNSYFPGSRNSHMPDNMEICQNEKRQREEKK